MAHRCLVSVSEPGFFVYVYRCVHGQKPKNEYIHYRDIFETLFPNLEVIRVIFKIETINGAFVLLDIF